jgi:hypothetical protein
VEVGRRHAIAVDMSDLSCYRGTYQARTAVRPWVKPLAQRSMPCQAVPVADRVRFFRFITESVPYRYLTEKLTPGGPLFPDCGPR